MVPGRVVSSYRHGYNVLKHPNRKAFGKKQHFRVQWYFSFVPQNIRVHFTFTISSVAKWRFNYVNLKGTPIPVLLSLQSSVRSDNSPTK